MVFLFDYGEFKDSDYQNYFFPSSQQIIINYVLDFISIVLFGVRCLKFSLLKCLRMPEKVKSTHIPINVRQAVEDTT